MLTYNGNIGVVGMVGLNIGTLGCGEFGMFGTLGGGTMLCGICVGRTLGGGVVFVCSVVGTLGGGVRILGGCICTFGGGGIGVDLCKSSAIFWMADVVSSFSERNFMDGFGLFKMAIISVAA